MKDERYIIFGASGGGIKVAKTLINLGIDFEYFVDNDSKKWGTYWEDKLIKSPDDLLADDVRIIIASDYQSEIEKQLDNMGILNRLVLKEELIMDYFLNKNPIRKDVISVPDRERKIITELADAGICLGGIETWALMVSRDFKERGRDVTLITREMEQVIPDDVKDITIVVNYDYERYKESISETVDILIAHLPCTVISNWQSQVMIAAILVKQLYPDKISILSVVHNDKLVLYRRQSYLEPYTDYIFCVSNKIRRIFQEEYGIPKEKLVYKESPIKFTEYEKTYTTDSEQPLKIGFAARVSKYQKRADLLVKVIQALEEKKVHCEIEIAGDGTYFDNLKDGVRDCNNVKLLGCIAREQIADFWKEKDIFLSVSDFEGTSISMLEAMSWGVIPIVTLVSGVDEFVEHGANGYYSLPGDWEAVVDNIIRMESQREKLPQFGTFGKNLIKEKCVESDYIDILEGLIAI